MAAHNILFIAPRLPEYDRASGDLRLYRILEILKDQYRLFFYNDGLWERFLPRETKYLGTLEKIGVRVVGGERELLRLLRKESIFAVVAEFHHLGRKYERKLRKYGYKMHFIVDSVDVHFVREYLQGQIIGNQRLSAQSESKRAELEAYISADYVWVVSNSDKDVLVSSGISEEKISTIPNIHRCQSNAPPLSEREQNSILFIGGFKHSPNEDAIVYFCNKILPLIQQRVPNVRLKIVGDSPGANVKKLERANVEVTGFVADTKPYLDNASVAIAPLRFGAGLKGKVTEALASGIPVVTTSIGSQGLELSSWTHAVVEDQPEAFAAAVIRVLRDGETWQTLSKNALKFMEEKFGYEGVKQTVLDFFEKLPDGAEEKSVKRGFLSYLLSPSRHRL